MSQQSHSEEPLVGEVRFRVPLPLVIPLIALTVIAVLAIGFSRVLLAIPAEAATVVATAMMINVMGVCAYAAFRRNMTSSTYMELIAILIYPVLIGIVIANINLGGESEATESHAAPAAGAGITVAAANIAFDVTEITVTAGEDVSIDFNNEDAVEHNISVYPDQAAGGAMSDALFTGEIIPAGDSTTYDMGTFEKGEFYFQCDVHPNMNGPFISE